MTTEGTGPVGRLSRQAVDELLADVPPEVGWKQICWGQGNSDPWEDPTGEDAALDNAAYSLTAEEQSIMAELRSRIAD
jgi:hypothetical protein